MGVVADAQAAGRGGLLHPRGDVDGEAADAAFAIDAAAEQHVAGVDADADAEAAVAMRRLHLGAERLSFGQQREAAAHGALGIVFADFVGAEGGEQVVAGVLQHLAAMRRDDGAEARQRAIDHGMRLFRIETLRQGGRADEVEEQDADLAQRLPGRRGGLGQLGQPGAQAGDRCIDHRIAEDRPLGFERRDAGLQLLLWRHEGKNSNPGREGAAYQSSFTASASSRPIAARAASQAVTVPAAITAAQSAASRSQGSSRSMVQWKLCGLTTFTSTALTATPSARPSTAPTPVQTAPSAATTATIWARASPRCESRPNSLRRASTCAEKLAAMPNRPIAIATACSQ